MHARRVAARWGQEIALQTKSARVKMLTTTINDETDHGITMKMLMMMMMMMMMVMVT